MVTRAKEDSVHNRRIIAKSIMDEAVLVKLFKEIGPRYKERNGGYTRIYKLGQRSGDAAEVVILELIDRKVKEKKKRAKDKKEAAKEEKPKEEAAPAEEAKLKPFSLTQDQERGVFLPLFFY
jgi:large subunit ribosomal protein L17